MSKTKTAVTTFSRLMSLMIVVFLVFFSSKHSLVLAETSPLPKPPSEEELERLRELGRQNELLYGSRPGVSVTPSKNQETNQNQEQENLQQGTPSATVTPEIEQEQSREQKRNNELDIPPKEAPAIQRFFTQVMSWFRNLFARE